MDAPPVSLERELLGGDRRWTRLEVADQAGVEIDHAHQLWRALGFADVSDDEKAFTDADVTALRTVKRLVDEGWLDTDSDVAMTRALGQSLARLADWQVSMMTDAILGGTDDAGVAVERAQELVPVVEDLIGYVWRRHLAAAAGRALAGGPEELTARTMAVGFADLVGFTSLTRSLGETELAELVDRFDSTASDIIAVRRGRVVKTVGDEVMFAADSPDVAADIALDLLDAIGPASDLPDLRVGVAWGTVLARLGDLYGEPVNLASRLTSVARPCSILVDRELGHALEDDPRYRLRRLAPRPVRGYALLQPVRLRRASEEGDHE